MPTEKDGGRELHPLGGFQSSGRLYLLLVGLAAVYSLYRLSPSLQTVLDVLIATAFAAFIIPWYLYVRTVAMNDLQLRAFQLFSILYVAFAFSLFLGS